MIIRILLLSVFLLLLNCHGQQGEGQLSDMEDSEAAMEMARTAEPPAPPPPPPPPPQPSSSSSLEDAQAEEEPADSTEIGKKIIKDGQMRLKVEDLPATKSHLDSILNNYQAYYENEQFNATDYQSTYDLKIRVPSEQFEPLLSAIEMGDGEVLSKNITARDVTEEYVDLTIRLANNRKYLQRYNQLLAQANSVRDILEIQERTRRIEEEIDSKLGRLKYLDDRVKYSTLNLTLLRIHEQEMQKTAYGTKVIRAFKDGFDIFLNFLLVLVNLWPFILLALIIWMFRKRIRSLFSKRNS